MHVTVKVTFHTKTLTDGQSLRWCVWSNLGVHCFSAANLHFPHPPRCSPFLFWIFPVPYECPLVKDWNIKQIRVLIGRCIQQQNQHQKKRPGLERVPKWFKNNQRVSSTQHIPSIWPNNTNNVFPNFRYLLEAAVYFLEWNCAVLLLKSSIALYHRMDVVFQDEK